PQTLALYGIGQPKTDSYGRRCLIARRLVERGVRFVQIFVQSQIWDTHSKNAESTRTCCEKTDQPAAALLRDLKQRGLLDSTLIVWTGEFGRTPVLQGARSKTDLGRDHLRTAFTIWMAGGGLKKGFHLGKTDDFGMNATEDPVHVHDLQATT